MSDNKCKACGQFSGKGHQCPAVYAPIPFEERRALPNRSAGDADNLDVDARIARAEEHLASLRREKVERQIEADRERDRINGDRWKQRRDAALLLLNDNANDFTDSERADILAAASDDTKVRYDLAQQERELPLAAQMLLAHDDMWYVRHEFAGYCVNPDPQVVDAFRADPDRRVLDQWYTARQERAFEANWRAERDKVRENALNDATNDDARDMVTNLTADRWYDRLRAVENLPEDTKMPAELYDFLENDPHPLVQAVIDDNPRWRMNDLPAEPSSFLRRTLG